METPHNTFFRMEDSICPNFITKAKTDRRNNKKLAIKVNNTINLKKS